MRAGHGDAADVWRAAGLRRPDQGGEFVTRVIRMGRIRLLLGALLSALVLAAGGGCSVKDSRNYRFVTVEKGDLESVVTSTGTLSAVTSVQVGTQISGIVAEIRADFNDMVRADEIIAVIDTTLLASAVAEARVSLDRSIAQMRLNEVEFRRAEELLGQALISQANHDAAKYQLEASRAAVSSAQVALERARQNLTYATIRSPIAGTVVSRSVDVGQTVAASLSAPELFLIADLSRMQILSSVDESDIGRIRVGQPVRFTIQAFPEQAFDGTVRQVRLQSRMEESIVNYTVVVDVNREDKRLLPGMTATVEFITETASDVLMVSNAALRFRPPEDMAAELRKLWEERRASMPDSARGGQGQQRGQQGQHPGQQQGQRPGGGVTAGRAVLYSVGPDGKLSVHPVRTGLTDGRRTVIHGRDLEEGTQVIAGIASRAEQSAAQNPFQPAGGTRQRGPRGPI